MVRELHEVTPDFKKGGWHVIVRESRQQSGCDGFISPIIKG